MQSMGVYLHIPFCVKKCDYCDFLSGPASKQQQKEYVEALKREILYEAPAYQSYRIKTIFIGGGTPSILEAESICEILQCIREQYAIDSDAEITIELNPGTAARQKLIQLNAAGINRLSIGLQSADNKELQMLGRIHTYEEFLQTYEWAREADCFKDYNKKYITFSAIQDNCEIATKEWKKEYNFVNQLVHASPQGTMYRLGGDTFYSLPVLIFDGWYFFTLDTRTNVLYNRKYRTFVLIW